MEVTLVNRSVYSLPSKQRVGAIVFDGTADMQLWPGPGPEAELREHYGDDLQRALNAELKHVSGKRLEIPSVIRIHPGRLHCNFLAWIASRDPEPGSTRSAAPDLDIVRRGVIATLEFAAKRSVERIAFPALGGGPDEASRDARLATIVKAAHAYHETCFAEGRAPVVEEVLVCEASGPIFRKAQERVRGLAKSAAPPLPKAPARKAPTQRRSTAKKTLPKVTAEEVIAARGSVEKYNMRASYAAGDFFVHPKFGVAKVLGLPALGQIECAFEDGSIRKLVHQRV